MEIYRPELRSGEVLVRVCATTVNRTDCGYRAGKPWIVRLFFGLFKPRVNILGSEFAGRVVMVGKGVTRFAVGDDVFGYRDDVGGFGGHAEYLSIAEDEMLAKIPKGMSYQQAAPMLEGAHYALFYVRAAGIGQGTRVLINGATGAIGSAAVQICSHLGALVTAVCRAEHFELVQSLGAKETIDYETVDFTEHGGAFGVVFDAVGKSSFRECVKLLEPGGIYASSELGPRWENPVLALVTKLFGSVLGYQGKKLLFPIPKNRSEDVEYLNDLARQGVFRPLIDKTYPLENIVEAYRYVESGRKVGNVVLTMPGSVE